MQHAGAVQMLRADIQLQHGIAFAPFHQPVAHQFLIAGGWLQRDQFLHQIAGAGGIVLHCGGGAVGGGGFRHLQYRLDCGKAGGGQAFCSAIPPCLLTIKGYVYSLACTHSKQVNRHMTCR